MQNRVPGFTLYAFAPAYNFVNITNYQQYQGEVQINCLSYLHFNMQQLP